MSPFHHLFNTVLIILALYGLVLRLRSKGILKEEHSLTLARIVTDLCLPAVVFNSLAGESFRWGELTPAGIMLGLEVGFVLAAWGISRALNFSRPQQGAIVFCSAFGSSTFLGYPIVMQVFPNTPDALSQAVLISEIGVGYPIFILGPVLAAWFGSSRTDGSQRWKESLAFFRSPVFFALIFGLLWGILKLPGQENSFLAPLFQLCQVLTAALTPLAILSVGLMFKPLHLKHVLPALAVVVLLKLILKPLAAGLLADRLGFPAMEKDVLVLLAAMPPAVLGAVFLRRYGGDAALASTLLLAASIFGCLTLLCVFWFVS